MGIVAAVQRARLHFRFGLWLAILAVAALSLMPTISHARAWAQGSGSWTEICTAQGMKRIAPDADGTTGAGGTNAALHADHCAYCALGAGAGLPPAPAAATPVPTGGAEVPLLFLHAPRTLHAWLAAPPRAPPLLS